MLEKRPGPDYDGSLELGELVREALQIGTERIRDKKAAFQPFLIAVVNGKRGEAKCTHADYRQALGALIHETKNLPPGTERYVAVYYGTLEWHNVVFAEGFEGRLDQGYQFAQPFKRKGIFNGERMAHGKPLYVGRLCLMNPVESNPGQVAIA